jgi:hypothetical protein
MRRETARDWLGSVTNTVEPNQISPEDAGLLLRDGFLAVSHDTAVNLCERDPASLDLRETGRNGSQAWCIKVPSLGL